MSEKLKIEHTTREVISGVILKHILEKECVAILATKDDLHMIITAVSTYYQCFGGERFLEFKEDMEKLRDSAF